MNDTSGVPRERAPRERWSIVVALVIGRVLIIVPFYWMITMAFKSPEEAYAWPPTLLPQNWTLENFQGLFKTIPFLRMFWNSFWTSFLIAS